jgi:hypothetical protein
MFRLKATSYILVWLILFQSFSAVAKSFDYHAIDAEHLSEVHEHQFNDNTKSTILITPQNGDVPANSDLSLVADNSHNPADCHHCGHCNGTHGQWLEHSESVALDAVVSSESFYFLSIIVEAPLSQLLRPPKA